MKRKNNGTTKYKVWAEHGEKKTPYTIIEVENKEKNMEGKALEQGRSELSMASRFNWEVYCEKA